MPFWHHLISEDPGGKGAKGWFIRVPKSHTRLFLHSAAPGVKEHWTRRRKTQSPFRRLGGGRRMNRPRRRHRTAPFIINIHRSPKRDTAGVQEHRPQTEATDPGPCPRYSPFSGEALIEVLGPTPHPQPRPPHLFLSYLRHFYHSQYR